MKEKIQNICLQIWQSKFTWLLLFVVATIPYAISLWKGGVLHCDSAYYLCTMAKMREGLVPYQDLAVGYTPLLFYVMYVLSAPLGISAYTPEYFLFIHFLFVAGNAICMYFITRYFSKNLYLALFVSWLYLISCYWIDGNYILLEIPSTFFGLLASCLILYHNKRSSWWFMLYGIVAACAFWTKQYGLGYFFLCALLIVFQKKRWQKLGLYILGYVLTFIICFGIWGENLLPLVTTGYGTKSAIEAGYDRSLQGILYSYTDFITWFVKKNVPILPLSLLFVFVPFKDRAKRLEWLFCLFGFFGFSLIFIFNISLHYCQYLLPFVLVLGLLLGTYLPLISNLYLRKGINIVYILLMSVTIVSNMNKTYRSRLFQVNPEVQLHDEKCKAIAQTLQKYVQKDETIWIFQYDLIQVYYYGQFTPPNVKTRGYSFGSLAINQEKTWKNILVADYIFMYNTIHPNEYVLTDSVKTYLEQYRAIPIDAETVLYDMRQPQIN